jgi:periplasmic divalent cation tolerance protein
MSTEYCLVLCTCPDRAAADALAEALVAERLAACVNILPGLTSVYAWEGQIERAEELLLLIKSAAASFPALEAAIKSRHPYSVPEIIAVPLAHGSADYLQWMNAWLRPAP